MNYDRYRFMSGVESGIRIYSNLHSSLQFSWPLASFPGVSCSWVGVYSQGKGEGMKEEWIAYVLKQTLQGLKYFHDQGQVTSCCSFYKSFFSLKLTLIHRARKNAIYKIHKAGAVTRDGVILEMALRAPRLFILADLCKQFNMTQPHDDGSYHEPTHE